MSIQTQDRGEVSALHAMFNGTGSTAPDGSKKRSHEESKGLWKTQPTRIAPPSNESRTIQSRKANANPYSRTNYNDIDRSTQRSAPRDNRGPRGNPSSRSLVPPSGMVTYLHPAPSSILNKSRASKKSKQNSTVVGNRIGAVYAAHTAHNATQPSGSNNTVPTNTMRHSSQEIEEIFDGSPSLSEKGGRSPKRMKLDQDNSFQPLEPTELHEVINVDDDEDVGVVVQQSQSDDPMLLRAGSLPPDNPRPSSSVSRILGVSDTPSPDHPFAQKRKKKKLVSPPPPGPNTRALKVAQQNGYTPGHARETPDGDGSDPIQDPDDFGADEPQRSRSPVVARSKRKSTPSGTTEFLVGAVRDKVRIFDGQGDRPDHPPHIDLVEKRMTRVQGMKPKILKDKAKELLTSTKPANAHNLGKPPQRLDRRQQDPIATSTSGFRSAGRADESEEAFLLPIEQWTLGTRVFDSVTSDDPTPQYWFCVRGAFISVLCHPIERQQSTFEYELGNDINRLEMPKTYAMAKEFPLLIFALRETERTKHMIQNTEGFESSDKPEIAIKLLTSHANWSMGTYNSIAKVFKSQKCGVGSLQVSDSRGRWSVITGETTAPRPKPKARPVHSNSSSSTLEHLGVRRSARHSLPEPRKLDRPPSPPADETILLYPPTGTGAVNLTNGDLKRLEPGEYLNDTLIEFGLKLWLNELRNERPEFADQVHVFSSFFYTQLNQKNLEEGYRSVRKWTSKFDLFKKKYIIVPINEHLHWYLAIICHPERALQQPAPTQSAMPNVTTRTKLQESLATNPQTGPSAHLVSTSSRLPNPSPPLPSSKSGDEVEQEIAVAPASPHTPPQLPPRSPASPTSSLTILSPSPAHDEVIAMTESEGEYDRLDGPSKGPLHSPGPAKPSDTPEPGAIPPSTFYGVSDPNNTKPRSKPMLARDEQEDEEIDQLDSEMEVDNDDAMDVDVPAPVIEPRKPNEPYIFSFDSLGARHPHALKVLSRYLVMEAKDKKGLDETVPKITTKQASVPAQPNYCDCGVYLLHFVQQFMSEPETFSRHIIEHTKSKANAANRLTREQLWKHDVVAGRREDMKQKLLSLSSDWKRGRGAGEEGKGKGKAEVERSTTPAQSIAVDHDSDIEVLDPSPEPSKPTRRPRAERIR